VEGPGRGTENISQSLVNVWVSLTFSVKISVHFLCITKSSRRQILINDYKTRHFSADS